MKCPNCSQDSIYIQIDQEERTIIKCNLCNLNEILTGYFAQFINFQIDAEEHYQQGIVDCISGKDIKDNPGLTPALFNMWEKGFNSEKESLEDSVSSFSWQKQLEEKQLDLIKRIDKIEEKNKIINKLCLQLVKCFQDLKKKNYLLGRSYRKDIDKINKDIPNSLGYKELDKKTI